MSGKSVSQECPIKVSYKSAPQEQATRVSCKSVPHDLSEKTIKQERSARVVFNAIEHLLFAFHCSVRTLLLHEFFRNAFGFVVSIRFVFSLGAILNFRRIRS